jgi:hypothetical protein
LAGFLWTREAVSELIARRYGLWLARTTVGGYLRGWGFSSQRPQRRALEQNPAAVRRWLVETYPAIRAQAQHGLPRDARLPTQMWGARPGAPHC